MTQAALFRCCQTSGLCDNWRIPVDIWRLHLALPKPRHQTSEDPVYNPVSQEPAANDPVKDLAADLLKELVTAFRERQQFGSGGTRSPSGVAVERIKLLANFFNTVAAGLLTAGVIGPMAAYLYGFSVSSRPVFELAQGVLVLLILSLILHLMGRAVLGRLAP